MTCKLIQMPVTLTVKGPILTAGFTRSGWGLDATFYRNWEGRLALPASHIRGKLKEAMSEIQTLAPVKNPTCAELFGAVSRNEINQTGSYDPQRGILKISDFIVDETFPDSIRTRIRIESDRGTAHEGAIMISESPFPSGKDTKWHGTVEFFAGDSEKAGILENIKHAFLFLHAVGADKTVGYGCVKKVEFGNPVEPATVTAPFQASPRNGFSLSLTPTEPFIIGGVRHMENIFTSETIISGSIIKGSFAAGLNRLAGNTLTMPIDETNQKIQEKWPMLARYFSRLRFLQAIPSHDNRFRPCIKPLSGVQYAGKYRDIAFDDVDSCYADHETPIAFQIDWKETPAGLPPEYHQPELSYHPVTRTAIDGETRKANDSQLYSFHMLSPQKDVFWNSDILFPVAMPAADQAGLSRELCEVCTSALRYIGKRQSIFNVEWQAGVPSFDPEKLNRNASRFAVTLQSPALLINPEDLAKTADSVFDDHEKLKNLYSDYWKSIFKDTARFDTFFARQELQGGYLGMRYQQNGYRPFYLTSAGSTFVFTIQAQNGLKEILERLQQSGLNLPEWAKPARGPAWKTCPFVPENGFGEIHITLWNKE